MNVEQAYDQWSGQYDTNVNRTRDMEAMSLRETLADRYLGNCLEIGCGTGKNTAWLVKHAVHVHAIDLSSEMMAIARQKVDVGNVTFSKTDILQEQHFETGPYDLVVCSLVLEHIQDLGSLFRKILALMNPGAILYISELHPFKQYLGSKARFQTDQGQKVVTCFNHHVSEFLSEAAGAGLQFITLKEYFDGDEPDAPPRLLTLLFRKP